MCVAGNGVRGVGSFERGASGGDRRVVASASARELVSDDGSDSVIFTRWSDSYEWKKEDSDLRALGV